jgi:hypothetical protein
MEDMTDGEKELIRLIYGSVENALDAYSVSDDARFVELCESDPTLRIKRAKLAKLQLVQGRRRELITKLEKEYQSTWRATVKLDHDIDARRSDIRKGMNKRT